MGYVMKKKNPRGYLKRVGGLPKKVENSKGFIENFPCSNNEHFGLVKHYA